VNWQGKRTLVIGAGRSGQAAVRRLKALGAQVFLTDRLPAAELTRLGELGLSAAQLILGRMPDLAEIQPELIVLSPGVSPKLPLVEAAQAQGVPVWSEVELALHDCPAVKIGVTGTNGKTTTTTLVGELAKLTGRPVTVAGNIGIALSGEVEGLAPDSLVVAELSSFQLEVVDKLRINIAILLNVTPDHLDRHGTLEEYLAAKARIFANQTPEDLAVLNWDDPLVRRLGTKLRARVVYFSPTSVLADGYGLSGNDLVYAADGELTKIVARSELHLRGTHNLENIMAAIAAARELGLGWEQIADGLRAFRGVAHRQEVVGKWDGILFVNDSKGTNPDAAVKALLAFDEPLVLIAGGKNKGLDFREFMQVAKQRVKSLILLGMAADEMAAAAREAGIERIVRCGSFADGVEKAIAEARPGDVVLLSPACTSWDMFRSYEERGELFKELVRRHYSES